MKAHPEISVENRETIYVNAQTFFIEAIVQIKARFNFSDEFYNIVEMVKPKNARNCYPSTLDRLFRRFPMLLKEVDAHKAVEEWRDHVHIDPSIFDCANEAAITLIEPEKYWATVFKVERNGAPCYTNLKICIAFLFSMPFSNAAAERVFSVLKLVKTAHRNLLHNVTLSSLVHVKDWLRNNGYDASNAIFSAELIKKVLSVVANRPIEPGSRSGPTDTEPEAEPLTNRPGPVSTEPVSAVVPGLVGALLNYQPQSTSVMEKGK
jgi:hypothetical protein